ncbi:MAG TPA: sialidase family protein [Oscillospiraceae bacterium]|nr:sialidase family protein [Oscillospiraceae bacterium]
MLHSRNWLIKHNYPFGKAAERIPFGDVKIEYLRTRPDVTLFNPNGEEDYIGDNEHLLVTVSPDGGELLAFWTQSSCEANGDNHIVISKSRDGIHFTSPEYITGTKRGQLHNQSSWGFPVLSLKGRIYLFFTKELDIFDNNYSGSGAMGCLYSDDGANTWSKESLIPMPRSRHDNPDVSKPKNWIVWQKPIRDAKGKHFVGYTLVTSHAHGIKDPDQSRWVNADSRCYFMCFENLDENPEPKDIKITWLPDDDKGIEVRNKTLPDMSTAQEPAVTLLLDGRIFCIMRNTTGYIQYYLSSDNGHTFTDPKPLRYCDGGPKIKHPMSPCPIYDVGGGHYLIAFHNNAGTHLGFSQYAENWPCNMANFYRNPLYIAVGKFSPESEQPLRFGKPYKFLDDDDIAVGPKQTAETGTYTSVTDFNGKLTFWYPDRKYYLLGKYLSPELITKLAPE